MFKKYPIIKWSLLTLLSLIVIIVSFGFWFFSLLPDVEQRKSLVETQPKDLPYLAVLHTENRGKVLMVVTSATQMGSTDKSTGYELTELSRSYYVMQANGFEVEVASPKGGEPTMIIDNDDMGAYDYAFMNDPVAQVKIKSTLPIDSVVADDYEAIFFVGGKGAMFDFPDNKKIQSVVQHMYESDKIIGAVCHGPAALINVRLSDGTPLLKDKPVSSFTNEEELFLIPDAATIFPFLLQDKLEEQGARFQEGVRYLETVSYEDNLVTGQNPWSTWTTAETMVQQMGYDPVAREITGEENAIHILDVYHHEGLASAKKEVKQLIDNDHIVDRQLIAMHSIVAAMDWDLGSMIQLVRLTAFIKDQMG